MRAVVAVLMVTLLATCREAVEESYASLDEARARGAVERGWVPPVLPKSATAIREKHDLDTNECWGRFSFASVDAGQLVSSLTAADTTVRSCLRDPRVTWWPYHEVQSVGRLYQSADDKRLFFVVDSQRGTAFYWRCPT